MTNILYQGFFFQVYVPIPCLGYFSYYLICYHFFWSLKYSIRIPSISKYLVHLALRVFGSTLWLIIFTLTFKAMVDFLRFCFDHAHVLGGTHVISGKIVSRIFDTQKHPQ